MWNLRIDNPYEDILQHSDDISAAFRRMLYHPDLAVAFAYVFMEFVMIPVGMIFGARNSPSFWCEPAELRAHMAAVRDFELMELPLADAVTIPPPPTPEESQQFVQAIPDSVHQGMPPIADGRQHHVMYVDDNIGVSVRSQMRNCLRSAVGSAYICFGHPSEDRREPCLADDKFADYASHSVEHLGYIIDTRTMRVGWPADKRRCLHEIIVDWLQTPKARTPSEIAKLLGLVRNGALLTPLGNFLSIRLQWTLTEAIRASGRKAIDDKRWWRFQKVHVSAPVTADLRLLLASLEEPSNGAPTSGRGPLRC